jgi:cysteinyl-tRNA synthetase, unknown class
MLWIALLAMAAAVCATPAAGAAPRSFVYQLQNLNVAQVATSPFDLLVTDYSLDGSASGTLSVADVSALRAGGSRTVLAYLSIGEAESYRYYWQPSWQPGSPTWLGPANPDFPDNYKVRYWDPEWQRVIFGSSNAYLDQIIAQGFDGVYLDVIDAFEFWGPDGNNERPTAAQDMVDFVKRLAAYARHARTGFLVFPQNGAQLALVDPSYVDTVDGIGAEDTWTIGNHVQTRYDTDHVTVWLDLFRDAGKPVLAVDYPTAARRIDEFFAFAEARGYVPYNPPRALDQYTINPTHPPAPAGPSVTPIAPQDGADAIASAPPTFAWSAAGGAVDYQLWFSGYDSFRKPAKLPSPRRFMTGTTYTPDRRTWKKLVRLARNNGYGAIYWWVVARDAANAQRASRARRLVKLHEAVSITIFWIGEPASADNGFIPNDDSAWDECWKEHYGGIDDPAQRNGFLPAGFVPAENPFYAALPYNDRDANGDRKANVPELIPWAKTAPLAATDSAVKNRWLTIVSPTATCYAQWEDVGPFREDDARYSSATAGPATQSTITLVWTSRRRSVTASASPTASRRRAGASSRPVKSRPARGMSPSPPVSSTSIHQAARRRCPSPSLHVPGPTITPL